MTEPHNQQEYEEGELPDSPVLQSVPNAQFQKKNNEESDDEESSHEYVVMKVPGNEKKKHKRDKKKKEKMDKLEKKLRKQDEREQQQQHQEQHKQQQQPPATTPQQQTQQPNPAIFQPQQQMQPQQMQFGMQSMMPPNANPMNFMFMNDQTMFQPYQQNMYMNKPMSMMNPMNMGGMSLQGMQGATMNPMQNMNMGMMNSNMGMSQMTSPISNQSSFMNPMSMGPMGAMSQMGGVQNMGTLQQGMKLQQNTMSSQSNFPQASSVPSMAQMKDMGNINQNMLNNPIINKMSMNPMFNISQVPNQPSPNTPNIVNSMSMSSMNNNTMGMRSGINLNTISMGAMSNMASPMMNNPQQKMMNPPFSQPYANQNQFPSLNSVFMPQVGSPSSMMYPAPMGMPNLQQQQAAQRAAEQQMQLQKQQQKAQRQQMAVTEFTNEVKKIIWGSPEKQQILSTLQQTIKENISKGTYEQAQVRKLISFMNKSEQLKKAITDVLTTLKMEDLKKKIKQISLGDRLKMPASEIVIPPGYTWKSANNTVNDGSIDQMQNEHALTNGPSVMNKNIDMPPVSPNASASKPEIVVKSIAATAPAPMQLQGTSRKPATTTPAVATRKDPRIKSQ